MPSKLKEFSCMVIKISLMTDYVVLKCEGNFNNAISKPKVVIWLATT